MPANLRLIRFQYFHEEADADFPIADQVDDPQSRGIGECPEEQLAIERFFFCHSPEIIAQDIFALTYIRFRWILPPSHIRVRVYVENVSPDKEQLR